jgi:predicted dehydrogenase
MDTGMHRGGVPTGLGRRSFLAGAAGAAAAFTILKPAAVRGTQANSKVELGVVGLGGRGNWIAQLFAQHGGYKITAVADYFPQVAEAAGQGLGVGKARCFSGLLGYKRLIEAKVDAVALETPPWVFGEHAAAAVGAGCHVYMAKPVACDVPGCLVVAEAGKKATEKKKVFLVDFQVRTDPFWIEAVKRVREGAIEKIAMICSHYHDESFPDPPKTKTVESRLRHLIWVNDVDLGASYLVNAGIHAVDAALWLAGDQPPVSATGCSRRMRKDPNGDSHDTYSVTYEFADGTLLAHRGEHIRNVNGFACGCAAYGQVGFMEGNYEGKTYLRGGARPYRGGDVNGLYGEGAKRNIALFHKNVTEGVCGNPTVATSVNSTLTTILGRQAGLANAKVAWDEMMKAKARVEVDVTGLTQ